MLDQLATYYRRWLGPTEAIKEMPKRAHRPDRWLLINMLVLLVIGLVLIYSISPALAATTGVSGSYYVVRQFIAVGLGLVAFAITAKVPLVKWRANYKLLIAGAALLTMIAIILPVNPSYPAHRWVRFAGFSFESVEFVIFAILIWFRKELSMALTVAARY